MPSPRAGGSWRPLAPSHRAVVPIAGTEETLLESAAEQPHGQDEAGRKGWLLLLLFVFALPSLAAFCFLQFVRVLTLSPLKSGMRLLEHRNSAQSMF